MCYFPRLPINPDIGLLIIRVGIGLSYFFLHGLPKLMGGPERWERVGSAMQYLGITFGYPFWGFMAAFAESIGALAFALGFLFRPATTLLFLTMAVAFSYHMGKGDTLNQASHALEMGILFLGMLFMTPGKYALDAWLKERRAIHR